MADPVFNPFGQDPQDQTTNPTQGTPGGGIFGGNPDVFSSPEFSVHQDMFAGIPAAETTPVVEAPVIDPFITASSPVVEVPKTPVVEEPKAPVVEAPKAPVVEAPKAPVVEAPKAPVVEAPKAPVVEAPKAPVVEAPKAPVVEAPKAPVVEAPKAPVVEAPKAPVVEAPVETPRTLSDLQKKFSELSGNISSLATTLKLGDDETLDIIGSDNDTQTTLYQFSTPSAGEIVIKRIETDKENEDSTFNELKFSLDGDEGELVVILDDMLLFEESELLEDAKKKSQVIEKFNKFIFLTGEKRKDIEREVKAKEEEEKERRRLQDIFRNF